MYIQQDGRLPIIKSLRWTHRTTKSVALGAVSDRPPGAVDILSASSSSWRWWSTFDLPCRTERSGSSGRRRTWTQTSPERSSQRWCWPNNRTSSCPFWGGPRRRRGCHRPLMPLCRLTSTRWRSVGQRVRCVVERLTHVVPVRRQWDTDRVQVLDQIQAACPSVAGGRVTQSATGTRRRRPIWDSDQMAISVGVGCYRRSRYSAAKNDELPVRSAGRWRTRDERPSVCTVRRRSRGQPASASYVHASPTKRPDFRYRTAADRRSVELRTAAVFPATEGSVGRTSPVGSEHRPLRPHRWSIRLLLPVERSIRLH